MKIKGKLYVTGTGYDDLPTFYIDVCGVGMPEHWVEIQDVEVDVAVAEQWLKLAGQSVDLVNNNRDWDDE
jgi:hypothetical protein